MTVVEVGPATIRGPGHIDDELAGTAVESIDDTLMLVADRPVEVRAVIADLVRSAAGPADGALVVVHPSWWSRPRTQVLRDAVSEIDPTATLATRAEVFGAGCTAVVEIATEQVAVVAGQVRMITRSTDAAVCAAVARELRTGATVFVDAAPGAGGDTLASALVAALGARGVAATRTPATAPAPVPVEPAPPRRTRQRAAPALAGVLLTAACVAAAALAGDRAPAPDEPTTLLVEGRVGVVVPALWTVQRITDGTGSARVQLTSPADRSVALHLTQSVLPHPQPLEQVAATLRDALRGEADGVFTDFRADDQRGGRAVATYRERRSRHHTDWAVFADGALRIAIGCQYPPGRGDALGQVCTDAVRSAHPVFGEISPGSGTG